MARTPVAVACQGGGSQCAFVAGALKTLFGARIQDRYQIVGLSGTSGGAFTAALETWQGRRYKIEQKASLGGLIRLTESLFKAFLRG
jgi:predicted acylesterase/phospholipase RssA